MARIALHKDHLACRVGAARPPGIVVRVQGAEQATALHFDLVGLSGRGKEAQVTAHARRAVRLQLDDGDFVEDQVGAPQRVAQAKRAARKDDGDQWDGDPGPVQPFSPAQHQVVDRPDQSDVKHQQHSQPLHGRQIQRGQVGESIGHLA